MATKKILVLAYAISPTRGSEYSVAWNYVINMSKDNQLVVLYGMSGDHMGDISELEKFIHENQNQEGVIKNVRFVAIKPNFLANSLNALNKKGIFVYSFYLAYNIWHRQAYRKAKELTKQENFDLIHYLGPIGYREPGYLWKIKLPYIWGPVGGTTNVSFKLIKALPFSGVLKLGLRASINYVQLRINPRLGKVLNRVNVLMSATTENRENFKNIKNCSSIYLPENGIAGIITPSKSNKFDNRKIKLIWIGKIDSRKALIILLQSLKRMNHLGNLEVHIVGAGILMNSLKKFCEKNNLADFIVWHGDVKREKVLDLLSISHLNIITSVSEGNPTTIWEAMSLGVPTISLDHCGMHDTICDNCGIKIPIQSYEQVITDLAFHLDRLSCNPLEIKRLSDGVIECANKYTWDKRHDFFNNMYELAINNWNKND